MKYQMLLWPHANARYRSETVRLAQSELRLILDVFCPEASISSSGAGMVPVLEIEVPNELGTEALQAVCGHSLMYALFECVDGGLLRPVAERAVDFLGEDLPSILKYKGKTNELFLKMLINSALYASDFCRSADEALELLDPMCGRGTALFVAANLGWNPSGTDIDRNDLAETEKFLKRYFEYHKMKHSVHKESRTMRAGKPVPVTNFVYAQNNESYKNKDTRMLRLANSDAGRVPELYGKDRFHVIITDLPYGIQHVSSGGDMRSVLKRTLPAWRDSLKKGGAIAVSFNAQTLKRDVVRELMSEAGLKVMTGGAYDDFSHWVEQAVTRDIAVACK